MGRSARRAAAADVLELVDEPGPAARDEADRAGAVIDEAAVVRVIGERDRGRVGGLVHRRQLGEVDRLEAALLRLEGAVATELGAGVRVGQAPRALVVAACGALVEVADRGRRIARGTGR